MALQDVFVTRAQKFNHFEEQDTEQPAHSCHNCVRRQFSYPWTCNDGWPIGNPQWRDRGNRCANWTDQGNARVD